MSEQVKLPAWIDQFRRRIEFAALGLVLGLVYAHWRFGREGDRA